MQEMVEDAFLDKVTEHFRGPRGIIWEMIMGEDIHMGGVEDTKVLTDKIGINKESKVLDVGCGLGGTARYLAETYGCQVTGIDATDRMLEEASRRNESAGLDHLIELKLGNALEMPFDDGFFDILIGQDAWCYIIDKPRLIAECARVLRSRGVIAFTDWLKSENITPEESKSFFTFMAFPDVETFSGYARLLEDRGFAVQKKEDLSDEFVASLMQSHNDTPIEELEVQITERFGPEMSSIVMNGVIEMTMLVQEKKISRGRFIGRKI
jgi:ubiquinone/menaquinone biosynthesis C-methylase UbiE